ncbi:MAG: helix-turn-helix domain-containing protein [Clostridia bacterium]|nr:helix-turn-helix domain-containing protein [Clostridia bacterium]
MKPVKCDLSPSFSVRYFWTSHDYHWSDNFVFEGEEHNEWELVYVVSGAVECTEDNHVYHLTKGNFLVHGPMEFHTIRSADNTTPHVFIASFGADGSLPDGLRDGVFSLSTDMQHTYEAIFKMIKDFTDDPDEKALIGEEAAHRLSAFLLRLNRRYTAETPLLRSRAATQYAQLVETMTARVYDNCSLEEIASEHHISVSYVKQLFGRFAGVSPKAYYSRLRYNEAVRLLSEGITAAEVADRLNCSSPNYFSVFFKKMSGQPPARFVRNKSEE